MGHAKHRRVAVTAHVLNIRDGDLQWLGLLQRLSSEDVRDACDRDGGGYWDPHENIAGRRGEERRRDLFAIAGGVEVVIAVIRTLAFSLHGTCAEVLLERRRCRLQGFNEASVDCRCLLCEHVYFLFFCRYRVSPWGGGDMFHLRSLGERLTGVGFRYPR